jgi:Secretion system C-terminal sorting domain
MKYLHLLLLILLLHSINSNAQFSAAYAPSQWTTTLSDGSSGSVNSSSAPASVTIIGSDGQSVSDADVDYTITTVAPGIWIFNWVYHTNDDGPFYDIAGVLINGVFTQLTDDNGDKDQSGTYNGAYIPAGAVIGFRIRAIDNIAGNATLDISGFSQPGGTLPVKLLSFSAEPAGPEIKLRWSTASEMNSDHFEVERSGNGRDFTKLFTVAAYGSSFQIKNYFINDKAPIAGMNYYRLRMVDIDSKFSYSDIVALKINQIGEVQLYTNPVKDKLIFTIATSTSGKTLLQLYNMHGQLLKSKAVVLTVSGSNKMEWDIPELPKGLYLFKTGEHPFSVPFIKQ